jgi:hypothetical protein
VQEEGQDEKRRRRASAVELSFGINQPMGCASNQGRDYPHRAIYPDALEEDGRASAVLMGAPIPPHHVSQATPRLEATGRVPGFPAASAKRGRVSSRIWFGLRIPPPSPLLLSREAKGPPAYNTSAEEESSFGGRRS